MKSVKFNTNETIGILMILGSALCFFLATTVIKWSKPHVEIDSSYFTLARFILGFLLVCLVMLVKKQKPRPVNIHFLLGRFITNCIAVYCFYEAVDATSLARANILNMTYPIFVALITWVMFKDQRDMVAVGVVFGSFLGVWLILDEGVGVNLNNLWGLTSGVFASFSIVYLSLCRKEHDSNTILFFVFGLGSLVMGLFFYDNIFIPNFQEFTYLLLCSLFGVGGQYLLTFGFRYVTALEGGIISSSRILLAAILSPWIAMEAPLSWSGWLGALIIFTANVYITLRKARSGVTHSKIKKVA